MSSEIAIKVVNVSKCYHIYDKSQDRLLQVMHRRKQYYREYWALNDVSFEVKKGETVGIIGRNGSGKSTLLQMICGILRPTSGIVEMQGRVAALLELGSGFNPEFTGRENVYMNGVLLGLTIEELNSRFDDIAAFADIGEFIDRQVKTYSSGMYVRLAFSVIVHVDADILIVDEALSVGDVFFQAKCARKLRDIVARGTTLLFVSHDTSSVKTLCNRGLLLASGHSVYFGDVNTAVEKYYALLISAENQAELKPETPDSSPVAQVHINKEFNKLASFQRVQGGAAEFLNVQVFNEQGKLTETVDFGQKIVIRQIVQINKAVPVLVLAYHIRDKNGLDIVYSDTALEGNKHIMSPKPGNIYVVDWHFTTHVKEGNYAIASMASEPIDMETGNVIVADFIPISCKMVVCRGEFLPIYGVHWCASNPKIELFVEGSHEL